MLSLRNKKSHHWVICGVISLILMTLSSHLQAQSSQTGQAAEKQDQPAPVSLFDLGKYNTTQGADPVAQTTKSDAKAASISTDNSSQISAEKLQDDQQPQASGNRILRSDLPTTTLSRRSISKVSLASVGLKKTATLAPVINSLIWSQSDAERALFLLRQTPPTGSSASLHALTSEIMSIAAVPPPNAGEKAEELIETRLEWLAQAGQSDTVAQIVRLLPDDERWGAWKRWQVEYDLIRRADGAACQNAERNAQQSLDNFWHQSRIICALLSGDKSTARFAADIMKASGNEDDNFFQLVEVLLGKVPSDGLSLDLSAIDAVDLVLMDAAHEQISLAAFEQMPASMIEAAASFRYLAPDAALKTSALMFERGLQKSGPTEQIWRSVLNAPLSAEAALATLDGQDSRGRFANRHDGLASALLWVSLATRQEADTDMLIQSALRTEMRSGRMGMLVPLYASLIRQRMAINEAAQYSESLGADYALILGLDNRELALPSGLEDQDVLFQSIKEIFDASSGQVWNAQALDRADAWALLPVLEKMQSLEPDLNWTDQLKSQDVMDSGVKQPLAYHRLGPRILLALEQAAQQSNVAETGLLAAIAVQPYELGWIDPMDIARVMGGLNKAGLDNIASMLGIEVIKAHLLRRHLMSEGN